MKVTPGTCPKCGEKFMAKVNATYSVWRLSGKDGREFAHLAPANQVYSFYCTNGHDITAWIKVIQP